MVIYTVIYLNCYEDTNVKIRLLIEHQTGAVRITWYCMIMVLRSALICSPSSRDSFSFFRVTVSWDFVSYMYVQVCSIFHKKK